jgi:hypothetical protein
MWYQELLTLITQITVDSPHGDSLQNTFRTQERIYILVPVNAVCFYKTGICLHISVRLRNMKFHENEFNSFRIFKYGQAWQS